MKLVDKIAEKQDKGKIVKEAQDKIIKRAKEMVGEVVEYEKAMEKEAELVEKVGKEADTAIEKMSEEDIEKCAELVAYGRGIARGELMTKEAVYDEIADSIYTATIEKVAELLDKNVEEVNTAITGIEPGEKAEIANLAAEAAAEEMVEAVGGKKEVESNPELAKEIVDKAEAIGEAVAEEVGEVESEAPKAPAPAA